MSEKKEEKKEKKSGKPKNNTLAVYFLTSPKFSEKLLYIKETDCLFLYKKDKYYVPLDPLTLKRALHAFLSNHYPEVGINNALVEDIIKQITMIIPEYYEQYDEHYISLEDCMINTHNLSPEQHDKSKFTTVHFPFTNDQIAQVETPIFDAFLRYVLVKEDEHTPDNELVYFVQEMFGYLLSSEMKAHSAFFLYGDGQNGKSTLMDILSLFFGELSVASFSIETLTTRPFALAGLVGKRINICNEDESKFIRSDKFKSLISGDLVSAERKYGNVFEFRPRTKFIFSTNSMPTFDSVDFGLRRRIKIIPFLREITREKKDTGILQKIQPELPGILRWAIEGLRRLRENNFEFSQCDAVDHMKKEFTKGVSSTIRFFDEYYVKDSDEFTPFKQMYDEYKEWCRENNRKPVSSDKFGKELTSNYKLKTVQQWTGIQNVRGRTVKRKEGAPIDIMNKISF